MRTAGASILEIRGRAAHAMQVMQNVQARAKDPEAFQLLACLPTLAWRREALYAGPTLPLVMGRWESLDIDGPEDLELAQWLAREKGLA